MQVGRSEIGTATMMVLNVDSEVPAHILDELRSVPGILSAKVVTI
jgi:D-3-phosphoglycerate dehydrogenase